MVTRLQPAARHAVPPGRDTYRHGDLRRALLDAAVALAREGGPGAIVLREATRRAGVAPNAAYRHFANHQALYDAVRAVALTEMAALITRELPPEPLSSDRAAHARAMLRGVGLGYLRFAWEQPGLFRTAFTAQPFTVRGMATAVAATAGAAAPLVTERARDPFRLLASALDEMLRAGLIAPADRAGAEYLAWSAVHGMAVLLLDGPLRALGPEERVPMAERLVAMVERGLSGAGVGPSL